MSTPIGSPTPLFLPHDAHCVRITTSSRSYWACTGSGLLTHVGSALRHADVGLDGARRALMVVDAGVPGSLAASAESSLIRGGLAISRITLTPRERDKSLATLERILLAACDGGLERNDVIVALGGGLLGDVAGLAAATYRRGIAWIQCPTTLLAMVDASVGGKTAVNLVMPGEVSKGHAPVLLKNMAGAFHQPALVLADLDALRSLPPRDLRAGLAECVKHALVAGTPLPPPAPPAWSQVQVQAHLAWLEANAPALRAGEPTALRELIPANIGVKARIIAADEHETRAEDIGGRALLNLGHTFAHVLEPLEDVQAVCDGQTASQTGLVHGEAVALGLRAALATSAALGLCPPALQHRVDSVLSALGLPTSVRGLPPSEVLVARMQTDKKFSGGTARLILVRCGSDLSGVTVSVVRNPDKNAVIAGWDALK